MPVMGMIESADFLRATLPVFLVRCIAAGLCGAIVGLERELMRKPAGLRTNIMICTGSAIYMWAGLLLTGTPGATAVDPSRIAAQVVTGIGFLGAGCIIQAGGRVTGLTSAATIWVVAAIGLMAGAGYPVLALVASLGAVGTLALLGALERRVFHSGQPDEYQHVNSAAPSATAGASGGSGDRRRPPA